MELKGPVFTVSPEMELYVFTELSKWINFTKSWDFHPVSITLDGTKKTHFLDLV